MKKLGIILLICIVFPITGQNFIKREGKDLMYQNENIMLRGMAFGNLVWVDSYADTPNLHHSEADYKRLEDLGMNAIRFYLNYKTFENDATPYTYKQSGWDWIDQNITWAKAHGVFLILNMHIPQGGFQSRCEGDDLWTIPENQNRLVELWKKIAEKYKEEPQIAGYDILNEPTPSGTIKNWSNLAQRIIDTIRTVDNNHMIITERALALGCDYGYTDENNNYPQISEENLMYTVHMYDPFEFTHQNLEWSGVGDGGSYPDNSLFTIPADAEYATGNYVNPNIALGTTDWSYYEGVPFNVTEDSLLFARVVFQSRNLGDGKAYYDDFIVEEMDQNNLVTDTVFKSELASGNYWNWSENGSGNHLDETQGHEDNYSVSTSGNTAGYTIILPDFTFRTRKGYKYRISGWMKGENLLTGATASFGTDFNYSPSGQPLIGRNYDYLVEKITDYSKYIEDLGFPVYFGEFGAARTCFEDDKGGDRWVEDCLNIFDSLGYHFTYHSYKESSFGYYNGWDQPVQESQLNTQLKAVFNNHFNSILTVEPNYTSKNKQITVFPNPSNSTIEIISTKNSTFKFAKLHNILGNELLFSSSNKMSIEGLEKGKYILHIYYDTFNVSRTIVIY